MRALVFRFEAEIRTDQMSANKYRSAFTTDNAKRPETGRERRAAFIYPGRANKEYQDLALRKTIKMHEKETSIVWSLFIPSERLNIYV